MTSGNLGSKSGAQEALGNLVKEFAGLRVERGQAEAQLAKWRTVATAARAMADRVVGKPDDVEDAVATAVRAPLLSPQEVVAAEVPTNFTGRDAALRSLGSAICVRNSASKHACDLESRIADLLSQLRAVANLAVFAETLAEDDVQRILAAAAMKNGLPPEVLDGGPPIEERSVVDIVAHLLRREKHTLRTPELLKMMDAMGRPIKGKNPSGTIRNSILARGDKSPVVPAGKGRWRLREWQAEEDSP